MERPGTSTGRRHFDGVSNVSMQGPQMIESYAATIKREMATDDLMRIKNYNSNFVNNQALLRADEGNKDKLETILQNNEEVLHCRGSDGYTLLHLACNKGHNEIVVMLLPSDEKLGISPNEKNDSGETPLHLAVYANHFSTTKLLLDHPDININCVNSDNETALFYAVRRNNMDLVKLLLQSGIDFSVVDRYGEIAADHCTNEVCSEIFREFELSCESSDRMESSESSTLSATNSRYNTQAGDLINAQGADNIEKASQSASSHIPNDTKRYNAPSVGGGQRGRGVDSSAVVFQFAARSSTAVSSRNSGSGSGSSSSSNSSFSSYSALQSEMGFEPCATSALLSNRQLPAGSAAALVKNKASIVGISDK